MIRQSDVDFFYSNMDRIEVAVNGFVMTGDSTLKPWNTGSAQNMAFTSFARQPTISGLRPSLSGE